MVTRRQAAAGAIVVAGLGLALAGASGRKLQRKRRRIEDDAQPKEVTRAERGRVVCPAEVGQVAASTVGAKPGDFVSLRLVDKAGTAQELVWGTITSTSRVGGKLPSSSGTGRMRVRLRGKIGPSVITSPSPEVHGFAVGDDLLVGTDCAWDVLHTTHKGMALCGLFGTDLHGSPTSASAAQVGPGDEVLVYVAPVKPGTVLTPAPGWDVPNPVWARVVRVSPSGSILRVLLLEHPVTTPGLGLDIGSRIDITRDCIYGQRGLGG